RPQSAPVRSHIISQACFPKAPIEPTFARLRVYRETPREYLAPHSITSSARASSVEETVRPSVLAVFRLMASSNLVGACTGRSAGLAPLRMRSTYEAERRKISEGSGP